METHSVPNKSGNDGIGNGGSDIGSVLDLTILSVNDVYEMDAVEGRGGMAEMYTLIQLEKKKTKNCIVTHNGDFLAATSIATIVKGAHMVDVMNKMHFDYVVPGNHEFDYGPDNLKQRIAQSTFKWLATNVLEADGVTIFKGCMPYDIVEIQGFKIGIFSIVTHETRNLSFPGYTVFGPVIETAVNTIKLLRSKGAEVIIALTHQLIHEDQMLAKKAPGIDLMLGGHDHSPLSMFEGTTLIHKSGQNCQYLGRIDMRIERKAKGISIQYGYQLIPNSGYPKEPSVEQVIRYYMDQLEQLKFKKLTYLETDLDSTTEIVRSRESLVGNLVTDCVRDHCKTDICIIQGGAFRGDHKYSGGRDFTGYDLTRELPLGNMLSVYKIKACDLWSALEEGLRFTPNKAGCFPQISGMTIVINTKNAVGSKLLELKVHGKEIHKDSTEEFTIVSTTFIKNGGDGYSSLVKGVPIPHPEAASSLYSVMENYLSAQKSIAPMIDHRIVDKAV